jgi:predicted ATPase/class 3 adenylate cyclase
MHGSISDGWYPTSDVPHGTVTFLFTDIEGSTRLLVQLHEQYAQVLEGQRQILRAAFARWHGQEVDTQGDAFFVAFGRATEAVRCAMDAQHNLAEHAWPEGVRVRVRMGLHTGEPLLTGSGYTGMDVHRAARIAASGYGGQILLSEATGRLVEVALPEGTRLRDLGKYRLKDLEHAEGIYQLIVPGLQSDFPPLKSPGVTAKNLPIQLTSFIGREQEIEEVKRRVSAERLVTIVGAGGCGKTRLSLHAASGLLEAFPDGVWLVELAPLSDPALVAQTIARTLGLSEQGERSPLEILVDFIHPKRLLLVLDNCEHLIDACAQLAEALLRACPNLCVLATSREALGVPGETVFYVPSLSLPGVDEPLAREKVAQYEAMRLFQERAAACLEGFQITDENAAAIAQICRRLDGIPLAIELAAARVRLLSVEQIAARLDDCFHLLTGGSRTVLPRHQTLRAAIDWGYALLAEQERLLLRRLSVFSGSWTLEATEAVCQGNGLAGEEILDLLARLASKSMVVVLQAPGGTMRYTQLETIRQYGHEKLQQAGEESGYLQQHLEYFLRFAETGDRKLRGLESLEWLHRIEEEYANLRAALEWCFGAGQAGEAGVRLANALVEFWNKRTTYHELFFWLAKALEQSRAMIGSPVRAKTLFIFGRYMMGRLGKWRDARPLLEESLEAWRSLGLSYRTDYAHVLIWLGFLLYHHDQPQTGHLYLQEATDIFRTAGDCWGLGWALDAFSQMKFGDGDAETAYAMAREGADAFRKSGDRSGVAICVHDLGDYNLRLGNYLESRGYLEEALSVFREFGFNWMASQTLMTLGEAARALDEYEKAEDCYREGLSMIRESGAGPGWFLSPNLNLGYTVLYQGDDEQAVSFFTQALSLSRELDNKRAVIECLAGFAAVAAAREKTEAAARLYGAAEAQFQGLLVEGKTIDSLIEPVDRKEFERYQGICRNQLGGAAFEQAWKAGQRLTLEQALAEAIAMV